MNAISTAAGILAAIMHLAGALKSTPLLAALPFDLTLAAGLALAAVLVILVARQDWTVDGVIALPVACCGALWFWLVLAGSWSPSRAVLPAKLTEAVVIGPAMLAAGMAVAGDARALRRCADAALLIGAFTAGAIAWGLAGGGVVLGGAPGANPDLVRVQYQIAGIAIASAAGIAAVRAAEAPRAIPRLFWAALVAMLAAAALVPGGRVALAALALAVSLAPSIALWHAGRRTAALAWPGLTAASAVAALVWVMADPALATGLRTLERLVEGAIVQESGRATLWGAALDQGGAALPWGLGTGAFGVAAGHGDGRALHPHNHALEALAEGGLPGLLLWLGAFGGGAAAALVLGARAEGWRTARVAALVLPVALSVMVSTDLGNRMAWFALGLALGLGVRTRRHVPAVRQARV